MSHWVNAICDRSMQELHDLSKPFKYIVSCVIVQKNGAGFHLAHSAYWDMSNDNVCQAGQEDGNTAWAGVGRAGGIGTEAD